jgi:hypothetical protein
MSCRYSERVELLRESRPDSRLRKHSPTVGLLLSECAGHIYQLPVPSRPGMSPTVYALIADRNAEGCQVCDNESARAASRMSEEIGPALRPLSTWSGDVSGMPYPWPDLVRRNVYNIGPGLNRQLHEAGVSLLRI